MDEALEQNLETYVAFIYLEEGLIWYQRNRYGEVYRRLKQVDSKLIRTIASTYREYQIGST